MISKERIVFDVAAPAEGDKIGAFLLDAAGTALTSTLNGGKQSLDVNVTNPLEIDVGINAADDSVASWTMDGSGNAIGSTSGALNTYLTNASIAVTANNLDIRDLAFATDKVDVSGSSVSISGTVAVTQSTSPWVVSATDLDIRDLAAATDSVSAWTKDGSGNAIGSTSGALNVYLTGSGTVTTNDAALANTALLNTQKNVTTTTGALLASQQSGRKYLYVQNLGDKSIYVGASGVTTSNGLRISAGAIGEFRFGAAQSLHAVAASGTQDIRLMEAS